MNEFELIEKYFKNLTKDNSGVAVGIGDDAAIVAIPNDHQLATSVDTLVEGVHFFTDVNPFDLGFKSLAVNLSDMAAMAAEPRWLTLSLTLPENNSQWLEQFAAGFSELANQYELSLIGGDLTHGPLSISVQITGIVPMHSAIQRSGAAEGDLVYVSGQLGGAGLALMQLREKQRSFSGISGSCISRLLRPRPRIELGLSLRGLATSAIDISDGLSSDLGHIVQASGVGANINLVLLPVYKELSQLTDSRYWHTVLSAGDDYELCFTIPESHKHELDKRTENLNVTVVCIGKVREGKWITWLDADGSVLSLKKSGYRHF